MKNIRGFTLIEILVVIGILAILAAIAVPMYHGYLNRAAAVDLLAKHDIIRLDIAVAMDQGGADKCDKLISQKIKDELKDKYAKLSIGFEAVKPAGYRPVLSICANAGAQGQRSIAVAREAYKEFSKDMTVEKAAVLTDTMVSFAVPLTSSETAMCKTAPSQPATACGGATTSAPVSTPVATPTPPPASQLALTGCRSGFDQVQVQGAWKCLYKCSTGQTRDAQGMCQTPPTAPPASQLALTGCRSGFDQVQVQGAWKCLYKCSTGQTRDAQGACIAPAVKPGKPPHAAGPGPKSNCPPGYKPVLVRTSSTSSVWACK